MAPRAAHGVIVRADAAQTSDAEGHALQRAEDALALVGADPRAALAEADGVVAALAGPLAVTGLTAVVTAERAAGLALRELSDPAAGARRMRRGVRLAEASGQDALAAQARMSLAYLLLELGRLREALRVVSQPAQGLGELDSARLQTIRALVLQRSGRGAEALKEYDAALAVLRRHDDDLWECRLLNNRSILLSARGHAAEALADLARVRDRHVASGRTTDAADTLYNMGYLAGLAGDVPEALRRFDEAAAEWGDLERAENAAGRAEVLLQAGLVREAIAEAQASVAFLEGRGWAALEAEARLILAQTWLIDGSAPPTAVLQQVHAARTLMRGGRRPDWSAIAAYVEICASLMTGSRPSAVTTHRVLSELTASGSVMHAADLALRHGRAAITDGSTAEARRVLTDIADLPGASVAAAESWLARSLVQELDRRDQQAAASLDRAWRAADSRRALLGASELRAGAARRGREIATIGVRRALERGSVARAFTWVERERGAVLRHPAARPPADSELSLAFQRARWAAAEDEAARLAGHPSPRLERARSQAERRVVSLTRHAAGGGNDLRPLTFLEVRRSLGDELLVQLIDLDHSIHALVVLGRTGRHLVLGGTAEVRAAQRAVEFELRRTLVAGARASSTRDLGPSSQRLRALILDPLIALAEGRDLVVCPPASLAAVPWTLLAAGTGTAVTVAPSATRCVRGRAGQRTPPTTAVVVAGPGLPGGRAEAAAVSAVYRRATLLQGADAGVRQTLRAAASCDVLHVAAHGSLRSDNPLFSSLMLADGPLTAYDLDSMASAPGTVTLSACSTGLGGTVHGDEVLGLAWALLRNGTRNVVAPLLPVPDEATVPVSTQLHVRIAAGARGARALAGTLVDIGDDARARAVACAFVAFG